MIWFVLLVIAIALSIPHWLGIAPKKIANERRFLARMTVAGLLAGLILNTALTFTWRHHEIDLDPLLTIMNGGSLGAVIGLVGASLIGLRERRKRTRSNGSRSP
jgi:hypothetical protein